MIPPVAPYVNAYGYCPRCKRKSRAGVTVDKFGKVHIHYSVTSRAYLDDGDRKKQRSVRASDRRLAEILAMGYSSLQDFVDRGK